MFPIRSTQPRTSPIRYWVRQFTLVLFFLLLGHFTTLLQAQVIDNNKEFPIIVAIEPELDKVISEIVEKGIKEAYAGDYEIALETFEPIKKLAPQHPVGYVYTSVIYYLILADFRNYAYKEIFDASIKKTISVGKKWIRQNKEAVPWGRFYTAVAYGLRGLHRSTHKQYIRAFADGIRGHNHLTIVFEQMPDFYDALYGVGLYDYWYAKLLGNFMSKAERNRMKASGINKLKLAFDNGTLSQTFAGSALLDIYRIENRNTDANKVNAFLLKTFPHFINLYETIIIFHIENKSNDESIRLFNKFRNNVEDSVYAIALSYLIIDYNLARTYFKKGELQKAKEILDDIVNNPELATQVADKSIPNFLKELFQKSKTLLQHLSEEN